MIIEFLQNGYSSSPCSGPVYANFQGFLLPKTVVVISQTTSYIVPNGKKFIQINSTSNIPTMYFSGQIVPANTNGYLLPN